MHARVMIDDAIIEQALAADKTCARVMAKGLRPENGCLVGVRLNLNLLKTQKVAVQTIHRGNSSGRHKTGSGFYNGETLTYQKAVVLRDVFFNVHQPGRQKIASGEVSKFPMASCDGVLCDDAEPILDGIEVRFNPKLAHLFIDMQNRPVRWAEECTVYGHRAYLRGRIDYFDVTTAPAKAGDAPSCVVFDPVPSSSFTNPTPSDIVIDFLPPIAAKAPRLNSSFSETCEGPGDASRQDFYHGLRARKAASGIC